MVNKKERTHGGNEKKKRNNKQKTYFLKRKRRQEMSASSGSKGWIHVICVHDTTHRADSNTAGQKTLTNKDRMSGLVKHRDHHPSLVHRK